MYVHYSAEVFQFDSQSTEGNDTKLRAGASLLSPNWAASMQQKSWQRFGM
jgi:hypothetical protein